MTTLQRITNPYAGAHILVLGAAGFIGRWVARALTCRQTHLHLVVRNYASASEIFRQYGVKGELIEMDLRDTERVRELIRTVKPQLTFNLAGYGVDRTEQDEIAAYQINAQLVFCVTQVLSSLSPSSWQGQTIVHVGSALEYGAIGGNLAEDSIPDPTTVYGRSKLAGTELFVQFCKEYGVRGTAARLFTVYGCGEHERRLTPTLLRAAKTTGPIDLTMGNQKRDFTYVEDVAEGLLKLGLTTNDFGNVVNLATGRLTSVRNFVERASSVLDISAARLNFGALTPHTQEMQHAPVSIAKLADLTGWVPKTTIELGFRKILAFQNQMPGSC